MRIPQTMGALVFVAVIAWGQPQLPTRKAAAPIDLTGYWVSAVDESHSRMIAPPKGEFLGVPLNSDGRKLASAWDPAKDEASGEQCKSYGAAAIMLVPGRFHITWDNEAALKIEAEAGTQTRLFHFNATASETEAPSWQGYSVAAWDRTLVHVHQGGSLRVITTNLRPGYLRKNGIPYSDKTTVTEYYDLVHEPDGNLIMVINTVVEDPVYLTDRYRTSTNLRKQRDAAGWNPSACSAR